MYIYRYIYILYIVSSHHHLILFHLNVLNHHISSLHFFSAHSSSVTSLFFPSICSLPPTCFRATLSSSFIVPNVLKHPNQHSCVSFLGLRSGAGELGQMVPKLRSSMPMSRSSFLQNCHLDLRCFEWSAPPHSFAPLKDVKGCGHRSSDP